MKKSILDLGISLSRDQQTQITGGNDETTCNNSGGNWTCSGWGHLGFCRCQFDGPYNQNEDRKE